MKLHEKILKVMLEHMRENKGYINPNFLAGITSLVWEYHECENDELDDLIQDMWGC